MISSREASARQRLQLMQQSGVSKQISTAQASERLAAESANETLRARDGARRHADLDAVRTMLFLISAAEEIRGSGLGPRRRLDFGESKELVRAIIQSNLTNTGPTGKWQALSHAVGWVSKAVYAGVPSAVGAAANAVANRAGVSEVKNAARIINRARELSDATLTAVTTAPLQVPTGVAAGATANNANLVQQCLNWWMSPAAASAIATYMPAVSLLAYAGTAAAVFSNNRKTASMLGLLERYRGACTCCEPAAKIADGWMDDSSNSAAQLHPILAPALLIKDTLDKIDRYAQEKMAVAGKEVYPDSYHIAKQLWRAARRNQADHRVSHPYFTIANPGGHCPLALLIIATLFGNGDAGAGAAKAAAAIVSDEGSAVKKIRALIQ